MLKSRFEGASLISLLTGQCNECNIIQHEQFCALILSLTKCNCPTLRSVSLSVMEVNVIGLLQLCNTKSLAKLTVDYDVAILVGPSLSCAAMPVMQISINYWPH